MCEVSKSDGTEDSLASVEKIEAQLKTRPNDLSLRADLAELLADRHLFGDKGHTAGGDKDIVRLKEVLSKLPEDVALYPRAYLAHYEQRGEDIIRYIVGWASDITQTVSPPYDCDELYDMVILPFEHVPEGFWGRLVEAFKRGWGDSAAVFTLQALANLENDEPEGALDNFILALDKDPAYWLAAWACGQLYATQRNWQGALGYYLRALNGESGKGISDIHFDAAWCLGKLKRYRDEEQYYRACLEIDPDFLNARNNLGWSLLKQNKSDEALEVFEESIRRGNDGQFSLWNRARALKKLGRYQEAIEAWRQAVKRGKLPQWIQAEVSRLQEAIEKKQGKEISMDEEASVFFDEEDGSVLHMKGGSPVAGTVKPRMSLKLMQKERWLEEMVEDIIQRGGEVFGKRLRMFTSSDGTYGRQYPMPEVGRIDLLAEDVKTGDLVVIELKRDESHEQVVGQISLYMSWVRENLATNTKQVRGIICVRAASQKLLLAARNVVGVEVFEYDLSFRKV